MSYPIQTGDSNCGAFALAYWWADKNGKEDPEEISKKAEEYYKRIQFKPEDFYDIENENEKGKIAEKWGTIQGCGKTSASECLNSAITKNFKSFRNICLPQRKVDGNYSNPAKIMEKINNEEGADSEFRRGSDLAIKMIYAQLIIDEEKLTVKEDAFDYENLEADKKALEIVSIEDALHYLYVYKDNDGTVMAVDPAGEDKTAEEGENKTVEAVKRKDLDSRYNATGAAIVITPKE